MTQKDNCPAEGKSSLLLHSIINMLLYGMVFSYFALNRLVAKDEGFYVYATKLVTGGLTVYRDFFYPQMPLLPYVYALPSLIFGNSWDTARFTSVFFTVLTGLLIFIVVTKKTNLLTAWFISILYISCNFVFPWYVTAQTYVSSIFFLTASYAVISLGNPEKPKILFLSGILYSLAVDIRLPLAGLYPLFLIYFIFINRKSLNTAIKCCLYFTAGCIIGALPALVLMLSDADLFFFNNLGYHMHRSSTGFWEGLAGNKLRILSVLLGFADSVKFDAPHFALLFYSSLASIALSLYRRKPLDPAALFFPGLFVIHFLPTPSYVQYFCMLVPFMLILVAQLIFNLQEIISLKGSAFKLSGITAAICFLIIYFAWLGNDIDRYMRTGEGVIGIRNLDNAPSWTLNTIQGVSDMVDKHINKGDEVLAFWPGYIYESEKAQAIHGMENHFAQLIGRKLDDKQRARYSVFSMKDAKKYLTEKKLKHIVVRENKKSRRLENLILNEGYSEIDRTHDIILFSRG